MIANLTVHDLLQRLHGVKQQGDKQRWMARCPAHDDRTPSLSIAQGDNGKPILHCFAGCTYEQICDALGIGAPSPRKLPSSKRRDPIIKTYDYVDENGRLLFQKVRKQSKQFLLRQKTADGDWVWNIRGVEPVLYNLAALSALGYKETVFVVEGEKDADALTALGLTAVTNYDGAGKWLQVYNDYFEGLTVIVLPDNDEASHNHAHLIKTHLEPVTYSFKIVELPGLAHKEDVSDWLTQGNSKQDLMQLCAQTKHSTTSRLSNLISFVELFSTEFKPLEFIVDGLIAKGHLVVFGGRPKGGKSWFCLQLIKCIDSQTDFIGRRTREAKLLYVALEDGRRRIRERALQLAWRPRNAFILTELPPLRFEDGVPSKGILELEQLCDAFDLIVIDTLIAAIKGSVDENSNTEMGAILNELARLAHTTETAVLIVHHTNKSYSEDIFSTFRGASSIRGAYDVGLALERKQGEKEAKLYVESRDFDSSNMTLRQNENGTGWEFVGAGDIIDRIRKGKRTLEALKELDANGAGITADMLANHRDVSVQSIHKDLDSLVAHGYVERIERGSSRKGRIPYLFKLIEGRGSTG